MVRTGWVLLVAPSGQWPKLLISLFVAIDLNNSLYVRVLLIIIGHLMQHDGTEFLSIYEKQILLHVSIWMLGHLVKNHDPFPWLTKKDFCWLMITAKYTTLRILGIISGWWFGTFFIVPYIGNVIIPIDELILFRGVETTNQIQVHWPNVHGNFRILKWRYAIPSFGPCFAGIFPYIGHLNMDLI